MESHGWRLFINPLLEEQLNRLKKQVAALSSEDGSVRNPHPAAKLLATISQLLRETIPRDPNAPEFRQGNTLGRDNRHWFRAKLHGRYRLFYRFSGEQKVIIYVWINDERSLRKSGSKTDPYAVFQSMLESGDPPIGLSELLRASKRLAPDGTPQPQ